MSETNIMNDAIKRKEAMLAWLGVETRADVIKWHKTYTPWWTDEDLERLLKIYDKQMETNDKENNVMVTEFEKLMLEEIYKKKCFS